MTINNRYDTRQKETKTRKENMNSWHAWLIEQSLESQDIFSLFPTVKMKSEEEDWKEHVVEVPGEKVDEAIEWLKKHLKPAWYAHLVRGDKLIVVYKDTSFLVRKGESFEETRRCGRDIGIPGDQLPDEGLFNLARESGF